MANAKDKILALQEEFIGLIKNDEINLESASDAIIEKLPPIIDSAKKQNDNLTQLYCCIVEACINSCLDEKDVLIEKLKTITQQNKSFILAKEKGVEYLDKPQVLDADTYGLFYVLNDHYSKQWDKENYKLLKNGEAGNPIITHLIKSLYEDGDGKPNYVIDESGHSEKAKPGMWRHINPFVEELLDAFARRDTRVFSDIRIAFAGGGSAPYFDINKHLQSQFHPENGFAHFNPDTNNSELNMDVANRMMNVAKAPYDYVVTSNVLNCFEKHMAHEKRDDVFAAGSKLLKKGGKAIHIMEKISNQSHFNINLNRTLHQHIGQDLVYSFFREEGPMDIYIKKMAKVDEKMIEKITNSSKTKKIRSAADLARVKHDAELRSDRIKMLQEKRQARIDNKSDDFSTSFMVMHQTKESEATIESLKELKGALNQYKHRFNYYYKPVYDENPGSRNID